MFAGFSYNGHSALSGGATSANNSAILSAPPSPSPVKRAGAPSTPLLLPVGSPGRSSRDKSVDKSLPHLGLRSSNGTVSTVRSSGDKI